MTVGSGRTLVLNKAGQSMVEFALILPLMVLLVAGIFDLGRAFYAYITITNAAREGARYGTLHPKYFSLTSELPCMWTPYLCIKQSTIAETQSTYIDLSAATITVICPDIDMNAACDVEQPITVTVDYVYDDLFFAFLIPSGIEMQRSVQMMVP